MMGVAYWADTISHFLVETGSTTVIPRTGIGTASGIAVISGNYPIWKGSADATLTYTNTIEADHSILMWGYEE